MGFEADEIQDALRWLDGLAMNAQASALHFPARQAARAALFAWMLRRATEE